MIVREQQIINRLGLHARASAKLVALVNRFNCEVTLEYQGKHANAHSIMSIMMLAASRGSILTIRVQGTDEKQCMQAICHLITQRFDESE